MRQFITILLLLVPCSWLLASTAVTGSVKQETDQAAIPFATVSLLHPDSSLVTGATTDDEGRYTLSADEGTYLLQVSFVGYNTVTRPLNVSGNKQTVEDIYLAEETAQLAEVQVQAKRPLIERQVDKLVMNVSESPFAVGNSGQDILRKAPGVNIDKDGKVTVNGKSVEVYIDGRPSYMSGEQLKGLLQGTDGANIDKIEIITNPSSKYDAAGQGGIINIKLKKNKSQGLNGMLNASYGGMYFKDPGMYCQQDFVSLNLNYRSKKTYTSVSLTQVYSGMGERLGMESEMPVIQGSDTLREKSVSNSLHDASFQYYNVRLSNDWYIDSVNTLGFIVNVPIMKMDGRSLPANNRSVITLADDTVQHIATRQITEMYSPQHTANLNFTHVFNDSLSRELTVNTDYNRYNNRSTSSQANTIYRNTLPGVVIPQELNIDKGQMVDIYSAKIDFQTAFWKTGMIECGAKWMMSNTFNKMTTDSVLPAVSRQQSTDFDYSEQVAALYISASKQFKKKWNVKLGLRGELTYAKGVFVKDGEKQTIEQKPYLNLFPTVFLGYNPNDNWALSASYSRRIKRPNYWNLNPFVTYVDAHTYQVGNPELEPEFNNHVDLKAGWSKYISLEFNFSHTQQMFTEKIEVLPNGDRKMIWANFGTCTTHGGTVSFTEIPVVPKRNKEGKIDGAWLALTVNAGAYHFINRATDNSFVRKTFWASAYGCLTAYLPKDIQMSFDASYEMPMVNGYSKFGDSYALNFGFKKQFLHKTLTLSLNVSDILCSENFTEETLGLPEGYYNHMSFELIGSQRVSVGITYLFGQQQKHRIRNVGDEDNSRLGASKFGK